MVKSNKYKAYLDQGISTRYSKRTSKKGMSALQTTKPTGLTLKLKKSLRSSPKRSTENGPMPKSLTPKESTTVKTDFGITYDTLDLDLNNGCSMKSIPYDECSLHYPSVDEFDIDNYLHQLNSIEQNVERTKEESAALVASDITKKHSKHTSKLEDSFVQALSGIYTNQGKQKWNFMLKTVKNPQFVVGNGSPEVPFAFPSVAGIPTRKKLHLANAMICDWQLNLRKKGVVKDGECPYYQPSTQNVELRTFFGHMTKHHDWQFSDSELKGFEGSLYGCIQEMYAQRLEEFVSFA